MPRNGRLNGRFKHGEAAEMTAEYRIWAGMIRRCTDSNHRNFKFYGARGVTVCARWTGESGFQNFLADVGRRPSDLYSLDRFPDTNGGYDPNNVRWATDTQQARNAKHNHVVEIGGEKMCFSEAVERFGKVKYQTAIMRVWRGWPAVKAITSPLGHKLENA